MNIDAFLCRALAVPVTECLTLAVILLTGKGLFRYHFLL